MQTPNDLDRNDEINFNTKLLENFQLNKSVNNSHQETEVIENILLVQEQDKSNWQVKLELVEEDLSTTPKHLKTKATNTEESENIIANNDKESISTSDTSWPNDDDNENLIIHRFRITKQHYSEHFEHHIFFGNIFVRSFCVVDFFILAVLLHLFIEFMRY